MEDIKRSYYAIIPANVRYNPNLKPNAKLLYGEITALTNEKGYCWASNDYFASLYGVSKTTISLWIKNLKDNGYIDVEMIFKEGSQQILNSYLRIVKEGTQEKLNTPPLKKLKDNNTLINNTTNTTFNNKKKKKETEFDVIIQNYTDNEEFQRVIYEFVKMRKAIKAPLTSNALKLMLKKLDKLETDVYLKVDILEQSIMNSWKGIFPLKEDTGYKKSNGYNNQSSSIDNLKALWEECGDD